MQAASNEWKISVLSVAVLLAIVFTFDPIQGRLASQKTQPTSSAASVQPAKATGSVDLSILPAQSTIKSKGHTTFVVSIDSKSEKVSAVDLRLAFDPKVINVENILPGDFFTNQTVLLNRIDNKKGEATFTLGTLDPRSGRGNVANLGVVSVGKGTGRIILTKDTKIAVIGQNQNALGSTHSASVKSE